MLLAAYEVDTCAGEGCLADTMRKDRRLVAKVRANNEDRVLLFYVRDYMLISVMEKTGYVPRA